MVPVQAAKHVIEKKLVLRTHLTRSDSANGASLYQPGETPERCPRYRIEKESRAESPCHYSRFQNALRHGRVAQTIKSQTERERSPFAACSMMRIGQNAARSSTFGSAATRDRSRSSTWGMRLVTSAATAPTLPITKSTGPDES